MLHTTFQNIRIIQTIIVPVMVMAIHRWNQRNQHVPKASSANVSLTMNAEVVHGIRAQVLTFLLHQDLVHGSSVSEFFLTMPENS